jgi:hypothetical protein
MMTRQARPSAKINGFDTHMILKAVPARHSNHRNGHQVINPDITPLCRGPAGDPHPAALDLAGEIGRLEQALDADPDALMARLRELWSWWQANRPAAGRHHPPGGLGSHDN